jgi:hypothetical protein
MIEQMEQQACAQLADLASAKGRALVTQTHHGKEVAVHARRLKNGTLLFGYSYDSVRLERSTLAQLMCTDTTCPACQTTQARWKMFRGVAAPVVRSVPQPYQFKHLSQEVPLDCDGRTVIARPAAFQCKTNCPAKVHPPAMVRTTGWDLFDGGTYLGGGLTTHPETQMPVPLLPTLDVAKNWLHLRMAALAA